MASTSQKTAAEPFSLEHFREWAEKLVLDSGELWQLEPFQESFVADVLAGIRPIAWLVVPEGNGKTTLIAGLALYHCQHKQSAYVPVAASSREQAEWVYRQAEGFVMRSDSLAAIFRPQEGYRRIRCDSMLSRIQVFAADSRTGDGIIPTLALVDELHRHRDMSLYDIWAGKLIKRGGQLLVISTAGEPGSDFEERREQIRQRAPELNREGSFTHAVGDRVVLHEWALAEDGNPDDIEQVKAANPFSGITVKELQAKHDSEDFNRGHWQRFTCNLPTRAEFAAISEKEWFDAATDEGIPAGEPVWVGLDVAWKWDTTAAVPLYVRDPQHRLLGPASILVPPRDGNSLDPNLVEGALINIHERNPIHTLVMDTSRAEQLATWAEQEFGAIVIDRAQTNKFAVQDYQRFMEALREGWLKHAGDRGLTRHALNAVSRVLPQGDARFERPVQSRFGNGQDRRVIDALVAAAMVHSLAAAGGSVYEKKEMVLV